MSGFYEKRSVLTKALMVAVTSVLAAAILGGCTYYEPYSYYYAQPYGEYHLDYPYDSFFFYEQNRPYEFYYPYDENSPHRYYFESR